MRQNPYFCTFWLQNVLLATVACNFSTSELQKVLRDRQFFNILTWKCASRHSGVQFLNISTSKSAPSMQCFVHFYLKMCFSPQGRAIFEHLNFKKCSEHAVFCTFLLENVLLATAACNFWTSQLQKVVRTWHVLYIFTSKCASRHNFSTSQLQKVVRSWCVLYIFTSKCASRHSGVQFLISPLTTWLRTRRFNEPTFRLTRHTNHWKNAAFRDFSNIWRGESSFFWLSHYCIFFLLTLLHLLTLLSSHFTSSIGNVDKCKLPWSQSCIQDFRFNARLAPEEPSPKGYIIYVNIWRHVHSKEMIWASRWSVALRTFYIYIYI